MFAPVVDDLAAHVEAVGGVEARKGAPGWAAGVARSGSRPQCTAEGTYLSEGLGESRAEDGGGWVCGGERYRVLLSCAARVVISWPNPKRKSEVAESRKPQSSGREDVQP